VTDPLENIKEGKFAAALDMVRRTGADEVQVRYCEEEKPIVWMVAAHWPDREGILKDHWDVAGGMNPWIAMLRLCEATIDGGTCIHCYKPTAIDDKPADAFLEATESFMCWYRYDPELNTFRRSCEGAM
jgi:hypothetical protein